METTFTDAAARRSPDRSSTSLAIVLVVTGSIGWLASATLLVERIRSLQYPSAPLSCDINPFVSCGALFDRWQASLLGFPNPVLGVAGFVAPIAAALGLLAGARFAAWYWRLLTGGVFAAWLFITWLYAQSVFVIGILCPYCMIVWAVTIPMWWYLLAWSLREGTLFGQGTRRLGAQLFPFAWVVVIANYAVIAISIILRFPLIFAL
jgi:uncharacterized membrane protein